MKDDNFSAQDSKLNENWVKLTSRAILEEKGTLVAKVDGKQIALFLQGGRIYACNNRCPHEGYPLSEGHIASGCILTCNWHNWKFDLSTGETLVGGDQLITYETRQDDNDIFANIIEPSAEEVTEKALRGLRQCFDLHEYERMAREVARLMQVGADPLIAIRKTIEWTYENFEFGSTHAVPATADWLALSQLESADSPKYLTAIVESVAHFAWDSRREPRHPFKEGTQPYDANGLVAAIEEEDEALATGIIRGSYEAGLEYSDIEPALAEAALAHYQDFGHALIYVYKTGQLIDRLGDSNSALYLTLMLVRSIIFASREDLIPEFKAYAPAREKWDGLGNKVPTAEQLTVGRVGQILDKISGGSADIAGTFDATMHAASWQMLHYNMKYQFQTDKSVSQNTTWLSFTHALTFGNAVRKICERYPELWPQALLQIGCFLGRNAAFVDADLTEEEWLVDDPETYLRDNMETLYDHGNPELIVSCHLLKLLVAVKEDTSDCPTAHATPIRLAAVNRFLNSPIKRKHPLRSANQALAMVRSER